VFWSFLMFPGYEIITAIELRRRPAQAWATSRDGIGKEPSLLRFGSVRVLVHSVLVIIST